MRAMCERVRDSAISALGGDRAVPPFHYTRPHERSELRYVVLGELRAIYAYSLMRCAVIVNVCLLEDDGGSVYAMESAGGGYLFVGRGVGAFGSLGYLDKLDDSGYADVKGRVLRGVHKDGRGIRQLDLSDVTVNMSRSQMLEVFESMPPTPFFGSVFGGATHSGVDGARDEVTGCVYCFAVIDVRDEDYASAVDGAGGKWIGL